LIALRHYFPQLSKWFESIPDFRQPGKILFPGDFLSHLALWQRISGIESNNKFESELVQSENLLRNLTAYLGREIPELPSIDAICYFMRGLPSEYLQEIIDKMISTLNRKKFLDALKTDDGYILLGVDGVQAFSSARPLEHSTHRTHGNGKTTYHKYFLEAKIISRQGIVLSVHTEPVENPESEFDKQDCELKAFKRLVQAVAKKHPHMKFFFLLDSLYCNEPVINHCRANNWGYAVAFKGARQNRPLMDEFTEEINLNRKNRKTIALKQNSRSKLIIELKWCNNVSHRFDGKEVSGLNYIEGTITRRHADGRETVFKMAYIASMEISMLNARDVFNTCRQRWKIENQGFNFQKNSALNIGHNFCSKGHAAHNYYLFAQIAHIILQLTCLTDIVKHWRNKQGFEDDTAKTTLLKLFRTFKRIFEKIKLDLFEKVMNLYEFKDLRIRLPT
jgi:hypothetical protein